MPSSGFQPITLIVPAATFMLIMNARQARASDLIRDLTKRIEELDAKRDNLTDVEWEKRCRGRRNNLVDQCDLLVRRHRAIMAALMAYLAGILVLGFVCVFAPQVLGIHCDDDTYAIAIPGLIMSVGVLLTGVEMFRAGSALSMEHIYIRRGDYGDFGQKPDEKPRDSIWAKIGNTMLIAFLILEALWFICGYASGRWTRDPKRFSTMNTEVAVPSSHLPARRSPQVSLLARR